MKHAPELRGNGMTRPGLLPLVSLVLPCPWRRGGQEVRPVSRLDQEPSEYPAGAADQYAAVASVMRPGLPWQVSVLKLPVRGHLPVNHDLVRQALRELLAPDPGAVAETMAALGFPVAKMTDEDREELARFAGIFVTEVSSGPH